MLEVTFIRHDDEFLISWRELWGEVKSGEWAEGHLILLQLGIWNWECCDWSED